MAMIHVAVLFGLKTIIIGVGLYFTKTNHFIYKSKKENEIKK